MENKKQTYIAGCALAVSILSLIVTIVVAINQYKENIEVVADKIIITAVNLEEGIIECDVEAMAANTSHSTTSLLKVKAYRSFSGFKGSEELEVSAVPDMPLTLIQGGAEKVMLHCKYELEDVEISALKRGEEISDVLAERWISIHFYSAKGASYTATARFKNVFPQN